MAIITIAELTQMVQEILEQGNITVVNTYFDVETSAFTRDSDTTIRMLAIDAGDRYVVGVPVRFNEDDFELQRVLSTTIQDNEIFIMFDSVPDVVTSMEYGADARNLPGMSHSDLLNVGMVSSADQADAMHMTQAEYDLVNTKLLSLLESVQSISTINTALVNVQGALMNAQSDIAALQQTGIVRAWVANIAYPIDALVAYSSRWYRSLVAGNIGNNPAESHAQWATAYEFTITDMAPFMATIEEAIAGLSNTRIITPLNLAAMLDVYDFPSTVISSSHYSATKGHVCIGGFYIQWGVQGVSEDHWTDVEYDVPFPHDALAITCKPWGDNFSSTDYAHVMMLDTRYKFRYYSNATIDDTTTWIAMGY